MMKRIIYTVLAVMSCLALSCKKDIVDVQDFGKVVIDSISPGSGPSGAYIAVYGKNFAYLTEDVKVNINGFEGQVIESTLSRMVLFIPKGATSGKLHFTFNRKNPFNGNFDYSGQVEPNAEGPELTINESLLPMPILKSVEPRNGKAGNTISIKGYNFLTGNCQVFFGDVAAEIVSINAAEIQVKVPKTTPATVPLKIKQDKYTISAGLFVIDETPKGVREVYFAQSNGINQICKAVLDESGNATIQVIYDAGDGVSTPDGGIEADVLNGFIYWVDGLKIMKGSTDGSMTPIILYTDPVFVGDLDLDATAGKLYFVSWSSSVSDNNSIKRISTDGNGAAEELYALPGSPFAFGLKLNIAAGKLYWAEVVGLTVMEGSMNGHTVQAAKVLYDVSDNLFSPLNIAISPSNSKIFVIDNGLFSGALDGTGNLTKLPIPSADFFASEIEVDEANQFIYWITNDLGECILMRSKLDGTNVQRVITNIRNASFFDLVF